MKQQVKAEYWPDCWICKAVKPRELFSLKINGKDVWLCERCYKLAVKSKEIAK